MTPLPRTWDELSHLAIAQRVPRARVTSLRHPLDRGAPTTNERIVT